MISKYNTAMKISFIKLEVLSFNNKKKTKNVTPIVFVNDPKFFGIIKSKKK